MTAVLFVVFIVCLMLSFPVAIAMGIAAITPGMLDTALSADVVYIIRTMVVGIEFDTDSGDSVVYSFRNHYGAGRNLRKAV